MMILGVIIVHAISILTASGEVNLRPCTSSPCKNDAVCVEQFKENFSGYSCTCMGPWTGAHCDQIKRNVAARQINPSSTMGTPGNGVAANIEVGNRQIGYGGTGSVQSLGGKSIPAVGGGGQNPTEDRVKKQYNNYNNYNQGNNQQYGYNQPAFNNWNNNNNNGWNNNNNNGWNNNNNNWWPTTPTYNWQTSSNWNSNNNWNNNQNPNWNNNNNNWNNNNNGQWNNGQNNNQNWQDNPYNSNYNSYGQMSCKSQPCLNNGDCESTGPYSYKCNCAFSYYGYRCEYRNVGAIVGVVLGTVLPFFLIVAIAAVVVFCCCCRNRRAQPKK